MFAPCGALILAAGKGTRMHSALPKVLQPLLEEPMLAYVRAALRPLFGDRILTVIGHGAEAVRAAMGPVPLFVEQRQQLGTGHALKIALPALRAAGICRVLVVNGDMPLVSTDTLRQFMEKAGTASVAVASITLPDPGAYGRIVRHDGVFAGIVEAKDYREKVHGVPSGEVNAGVYLLDLDAVEPLLARLGNANASGEYYITDLAGLAMDAGLEVTAVPCGSETALLGVNTPAELSAAEELLRRRIVEQHLRAGVMIHQPDGVCIGPRVRIEPGAVLRGPCRVLGRSRLASGASVDAFCTLIDADIAAGAVIHAYSHIQEASVGEGCLVGPYARLRPGAVLEAEAHVGNFVEMKKARLGRGAKANHLTYLGDADVGAGSNIGAGTITCNYDGAQKHRTTIGERAFIGSNTALVAPVTVGSGALVGAGSVITRNVPDGMLAVARGRQTVLPQKRVKKD